MQTDIVLAPRIVEFIDSCHQSFLDFNKKPRGGTLFFDDKMVANVHLTPAYGADVIDERFWSELSERMDEFLEGLPTHWMFRNEPEVQFFMGENVTLAKTKLYEVALLCNDLSVLQFIEQLVDEEKPPATLECATAMSMVFILAIKFIRGNDAIKKLNAIDKHFFTTLGVVNNTPMMRLFRLNKTYTCYPFDYESQMDDLSNYPIGTHIYIRGSYMWWLASISSELFSKMKECGLRESFQGENVIVVNNGLLLGFWQDPKTSKARFEAMSLRRIIRNLKTRFMDDFNSLTEEKQEIITNLANSIVPRVKLFGQSPSSPKDLFAVAGITMATSYHVVD